MILIKSAVFIGKFLDSWNSFCESVSCLSWNSDWSSATVSALCLHTDRQTDRQTSDHIRETARSRVECNFPSKIRKLLQSALQLGSTGTTDTTTWPHLVLQEAGQLLLLLLLLMMMMMMMMALCWRGSEAAAVVYLLVKKQTEWQETHDGSSSEENKCVLCSWSSRFYFCFSTKTCLCNRLKIKKPHTLKRISLILTPEVLILLLLLLTLIILIIDK